MNEAFRDKFYESKAAPLIIKKLGLQLDGLERAKHAKRGNVLSRTAIGA